MDDAVAQRPGALRRDLQLHRLADRPGRHLAGGGARARARRVDADGVLVAASAASSARWSRPARALGIGLLAWSPLGRGVLTGKYRTGTPADSRGASPHFAALRASRTSANARGAWSRRSRRRPRASAWRRSRWRWPGCATGPGVSLGASSGPAPPPSWSGRCRPRPSSCPTRSGSRSTRSRRPDARLPRHRLEPALTDLDRAPRPAGATAGAGRARRPHGRAAGRRLLSAVGLAGVDAGSAAPCGGGRRRGGGGPAGRTRASPWPSTCSPSRTWLMPSGCWSTSGRLRWWSPGLRAPARGTRRESSATPTDARQRRPRRPLPSNVPRGRWCSAATRTCSAVRSPGPRAATCSLRGGMPRAIVRRGRRRRPDNDDRRWRRCSPTGPVGSAGAAAASVRPTTRWSLPAPTTTPLSPAGSGSW